jgi:hypothetical protein
VTLKDARLPRYFFFWRGVDSSFLANVRFAPEPVLPQSQFLGPIGDVYGFELCARQALSKEGDHTNAKQITLTVRQPE